MTVKCFSIFIFILCKYQTWSTQMKLAPLCVLVAAMAGVAAGELAPPERTYKILMLLPVSTKSHRNVFMPIAEALADRGHEIVMLTNHPKSSKHPNIHEVTHGLRYFSEMSVNMFDYVNDRTGCFQMFEGILPDIARELYKVPVVKDLYERRKEFDLIMVDHEFNEVAYPFVHEAAFVMVTTPALDYRQSAVLGNVLSPAYVPNHMMDYPHPYSFWHRFHNMMIQIGIAIYWRNWAIVPPIQKEISAQFPDLPPLLDLERNMSLALINTHFSISMPLPLLPSEVEVGGMHCRPASPLPQVSCPALTGGGGRHALSTRQPSAPGELSCHQRWRWAACTVDPPALCPRSWSRGSLRQELLVSSTSVWAPLRKAPTCHSSTAISSSRPSAGCHSASSGNTRGRWRTSLTTCCSASGSPSRIFLATTT
nr:UDP-glycosyltransferase UGT5-like isoform X3 [Procambarus clarkii]